MPKTQLVIVESPAKARTIEKYLGRAFTVKSSMGHIRGLPSKSGSVDVDHDFAPKFEVAADKKKIIGELKAAAKTASTIWLASDEDREGEAIAWHIAEVLKLDPTTTKRIVFHEITKTALETAIKNPGRINLPLVESQQARQTLDYLVGFELSPVLWRKVGPGLSAGRVQSVAARLVVEREREIEAHLPTSSFKIKANFKLSDSSELIAEIAKPYKDAEACQQLFKSWTKDDFSVNKTAQKPGIRNPSPPFTTSTLQQSASNRLGLSPRSTMSLAQRLYENGSITYMRTDSLNLSNQALQDMAGYVKNKFGNKYHQLRTFKASTAGAQEAHEAIRPTNIAQSEAGGDDQQRKLYDLIWRRTLSSQMAPARLERTIITIVSKRGGDRLEARGEVIIFDGFLRVYGRNGEDTLLPPLKASDKLDLIGAEALESLSRGPTRYNEASLVRELESRGIGRPSTYASTISVIQSRGYVERSDFDGEARQIQKITLQSQTVAISREKIFYGKDTNKLLPTAAGKVVTDFLTKHFHEVMEYDFTKTIEQDLDEIAASKKNRLQVLRDFYAPFHRLVEASADVTRAEASQARLLGKDPASDRPIYARFGRYGPMLQRGETEAASGSEQKPSFAPLPAGAKLETVTLKEALKMFELPRTVGQTEAGEIIQANIGRFGPYIKIDKTFVSIKPLDPFSITEIQARQLLLAKIEKDLNKFIHKFPSGINVVNGAYGPFVTDGKKNAKIPVGIEPKALTEAACQKLLAEAPAKKRFTRGHRKATK